MIVKSKQQWIDEAKAQYEQAQMAVGRMRKSRDDEEALVNASLASVYAAMSVAASSIAQNTSSFVEVPV